MGRLEEWRKQFVGRERLSAQLREAYRLSAAGLPQFRILLGPTGIGKTRLAQELYRWLSQEHDPPTDEAPQGYWPDAFATEASKDDINPRADGRHLPTIPWLWWGLKFEETQQSGDALYRGLKDLTRHTVQMLAHREVAAVHGDWLWKLFSLGFGFVPGVGNLPGWIRDGYEAWQGNQRRAEAEQRLLERDDQREERQRNEHVEAALQALRSFLDPRHGDDPRVPVVLFLDDAHWADPVTMQLLHRLWSEARAHKWPLLVIATHWDDEWQRHLADASPEEGSAHRLADFLKILDPHEEAGIDTLPVDGVPGGSLEEWLRMALPGITAEQQRLILEKSAALASDADGQPVPGGSPRIIEQIVLAVHEDPEEFFVGGDCEAALNPDAESWIRQEIHDLNSIVRKRFKKLSREVRKALGWSSLQGRRFLAEITAAISGKIASEEFPADTARAALESSEIDYGWIQRNAEPEQNPGRFNLCDFRQAVFHEVARRHFTISAAEREAADLAIDDVLQGWLRSGRLDEPESPSDESLTREERRDALRMIRHRFDPRSRSDAAEEQWSAWGHSLAMLVGLNRSDFLWEQAEEVACEFADARPDGWPTEMVPVELQRKVAGLLIVMHEHERALGILDPLASGTVEGTESTADESELRVMTITLDYQARARQGAGQAGSVLATTLRNLRMVKALVAQGGETSGTLRALAVVLSMVAEAVPAAGESAVEIDGQQWTPLELQVESLLLFRQVVTRYGESAENLHGIGVALNHVAEAARDVDESTVEIDGQWRTPLELHVESLLLRRRIVARYGETPQALRDVGVALERVGDAARAANLPAVEIDGQQRTSLELQVECLLICRRGRSEYGETPETIRDIGVALSRVADAAMAASESAVEIEGRSLTPLELHVESLLLRRRIVDRYGETPQSLRAVCESLNSVGAAARVSSIEIEGVRRTRSDVFLESLKLRRRIVELYGETPQSLRDVAVGTAIVAGAILVSGTDRADGVAHLETARDILRTLVDRGWSNADDVKQLELIEEQLARL